MKEKRKRSPLLKVDIGGLVLKNPVMTASGTFGYGEEYSSYVDIAQLGAVVVKGLSLGSRRGNPPPRIMETPSGMLNAVGLENVGMHSFIEEKLPFLRNFDVAVIVNILGDTTEEYATLAAMADGTPGIHAIEVNVSCPNVAKGGIIFGTDPDQVRGVTKAVKKATKLPVIVKLSPNVTDITVIAKAAEEGGADAVSLINTLKGMSVDIQTRRPHLSMVTGGLSGPAIKPVALRMVWETVQVLSIPVIGIGGIMDAADALEFLIAGAKAVQVGTAHCLNPRAALEVARGIERHLQRHGISDINDLIGTLAVDGACRA